MKQGFLILCVVVFAFSARAQSDDSVTEAAAAFKAREFGKAVNLLKKAYEKDKSPVFLFNIGRSYEEWGKYREAAEYYKRVITEEQTDKSLIKKALTGFQRVQGKIPSRVKISCEGIQGTAFIDGKNAGTCPVELEHPPGKIRIQVKAKGYHTWSTELALIPDGFSETKAKLKPLKKPEAKKMPTPKSKVGKKTVKGTTRKTPGRPIKSIKQKASPWPWVVVGLGAALAAAGGIMQYLSYHERMTVKNAADPNGLVTGFTQSQAWSKEQRARNYAIGAYVMYGIGGAAVLGGLLWGILGRHHGKTPATTAFFDGSSLVVGVNYAF